MDRKLLPRIHSYLDSLDPAAEGITPASIVDHLRQAYPEYARKPSKPFARSVEALCERMRREAMQAAEAEEGEGSAAAAEGGEGEESMTDVRAADDVVILSSSVTPSPSAGSGSLPSVSFAPLSSSSASASAPPAVATNPSSPPRSTPPSSAPPSERGDKKRRKLDGGSDSSPATAAAPGEESEESSSEEERDVIDVEFVEAEDRNLANSAMRNLYNRVAPQQQAPQQQPQQGGESGGSEGAQSSKGRDRRAGKGEKVVYTQNSSKPLSAKKRANKLKAANNAHFRDSAGGPDDGPGGIGGDGAGGSSNWHPEVLYPSVSYADLGGIEGILQEIHELIEYPLTHPEIYRHLGIQPPRGVLLHGPPGCGQKQQTQARAMGAREE